MGATKFDSPEGLRRWLANMQRAPVALWRASILLVSAEFVPGRSVAPAIGRSKKCAMTTNTFQINDTKSFVRTTGIANVRNIDTPIRSMTLRGLFDDLGEQSAAPEGRKVGIACAHDQMWTPARRRA